MGRRTGYLDGQASSIDEAIAMIEASHAEGKPVSVGLLGNAAEILPEMVRRGIHPDLLTDQTSAHDPVNGYLPAGWTLHEWFAKSESDPAAVANAAKASMDVHVSDMPDQIGRATCRGRRWKYG